MTSLSKILRGEVEPKTSYNKEFLTYLTRFFEFLLKDENLVVGLVGIKNRNEFKNGQWNKIR